MLAVSPDLTRCYEAQLVQQNIMAGQRPHYHKWLRYYLDFCHKYSFDSIDRQSLPAFQEKLRAKHQPESLCQQAGHAVALYWEMVSSVATGSRPTADAATQPGVAETRFTAQGSLERAPSQPSPTGKSPTASTAPPFPPAQLMPTHMEKATLPPRPLAPSQPSARQEREAVGRAPGAANPVRVLATASAGFEFCDAGIDRA